MEETKPKKKAFKEKYYNLSEDEMQSLIAKAKSGDSRAQLELLEVFSNFLGKYTTMLYHGRYNVNDYDIRRFIALFVKEPQLRFALLRNKLNSIGMKQVNECIRGIQYMAQRYGDEEDVDQTIKMAFLHCVSIYKRKNDIPFSGFLYSYFFYVLKKQVDAFLIDQLGRKTFPLIDDEDAMGSEEYEEDRPQGFTAPPVPAADELIHAEEIDEYWVAGDTAHGPFAQLTIQERQLLKWRYVNGERSSDIASRITEHPNTVREHFNKIREKIRESLKEELESD